MKKIIFSVMSYLSPIVLFYSLIGGLMYGLGKYSGYGEEMVSEGLCERVRGYRYTSYRPIADAEVESPPAEVMNRVDKYFVKTSGMKFTEWLELQKQQERLEQLKKEAAELEGKLGRGR